MAIDIPDHWKVQVSRWFPMLREGLSLEYTSPADANYNCLSWALGINHSLLENIKGGFWPWPDIPDNTAEGWAQVCEKHGYARTNNTEFVAGIEKIVILGEEDDLHAARQGEGEWWKSKLGVLGPDIDHAGLECVEHAYGRIQVILQRVRRAENG